MNFLDILKSIEQAIYEIALWFILIPKTIFKIVVHPADVPAYIREELKKEDKKQFNDQMSPILLWLLMVILPVYMSAKYFYHGLPAMIRDKPQNYFFYIAVIFISFLLTPAGLIHILNKNKFERDSFKESFYVQCYLQSPMSFLLILWLGLMKYWRYSFNASDNKDYIPIVNSINGWKDLLVIPLIGVLFFYAFIEVKLIMKTGKSVGDAIGLLLLSCVIVFFLMLVAGGVSYILFYGV